MKRIFLVPLAILLLVALIFGGCAKEAPAPAPTTPAPTPAPAPEPVFELRWASEASPVSSTNVVVNGPWAKELERRSGGRVKTTIYAGETLCKTTEAYDLLQTGGIDMCDTSMDWYPGRFKVYSIYELPFLIPWYEVKDEKTGEYIDDIIYWKYVVPLDLKDVKVLWFCRASQLVLHMAEKRVSTLEDLEGLLIAIPGGKVLPAQVKGWGASPEAIPVPDYYTSLERGLVDGVLFPLSCKLGWRLGEVIDSITMVNTGGGGARLSAMSLKTWNSLPPDIQQIIDDMQPWITKINYEDGVSTRAEEIEKNAPEMGVEIVYLSPEERARWAKANENVINEWVAEVDAQGLPGTTMVNEVLQMLGKPPLEK